MIVAPDREDGTPRRVMKQVVFAREGARQMGLAVARLSASLVLPVFFVNQHTRRTGIKEDGGSPDTLIGLREQVNRSRPSPLTGVQATVELKLVIQVSPKCSWPSSSTARRPCAASDCCWGEHTGCPSFRKMGAHTGGCGVSCTYVANEN